MSDKFMDALLNGIADAVTDIREKVVEEPWFGKVVSEPGEDVPGWPTAREAEVMQPEPERDREPDRDMER